MGVEGLLRAGGVWWTVGLSNRGVGVSGEWRFGDGNEGGVVVGGGFHGDKKGSWLCTAWGVVGGWELWGGRPAAARQEVSDLNERVGGSGEE